MRKWAAQQGVNYRTALRWFHGGTLPVEAERMATGTIIVKLEPGLGDRKAALYARVSSSDQKTNLDSQIVRLTHFAVDNKLSIAAVITEAGSAAHSYRLRRNELKTTDHHASTPLPVHASDLALKEAFETEVKYWAAIASEIHPRIASRGWTSDQKHYAYWLLIDEHRFSLLVLDRAPISEKISLTVRERKQVQNYLRRRARRVMKARPRVKIARSFALDNTLYAVVRTLSGQGLTISSLEKGKRIFIPLQGEGEISGNIRIALDPKSRK
ncbi:MAG: recombinase family protein, partial [Blastocatellia bacterium]|nr:recombinase family protein [Blastocatellia bacterium]